MITILNYGFLEHLNFVLSIYTKFALNGIPIQQNDRLN